MTRSNRLLNRLFIALVGLVLIAAALVVVAPALPELLPQAAIPVVPELTDAILLGIAVAAAVIVLLALIWVLTRGRGEQKTAYSGDGVSVDRHVVEALLRDSLAAQPDVVRVAAHAYRIRGSVALKLRVDVRKGAALAELASVLRRRIADLDTVLGVQAPVLVHLTSGVRSSFAGERRTR